MTSLAARALTLCTLVLAGASGRALVELARSAAPGSRAAPTDHARTDAGADFVGPAAGSRRDTPPDVPAADAREAPPRTAGPAFAAGSIGAQFDERFAEAKRLGFERQFRRGIEPVLTRPLGVPSAEYRTRVARDDDLAVWEEPEALVQDRSSLGAPDRPASARVAALQFRFVALAIGGAFELFVGSSASPTSVSATFWAEEQYGVSRQPMPMPAAARDALIGVAVDMHVDVERARRSFAEELLRWIDARPELGGADAPLSAVLGMLDGSLRLVPRGAVPELDAILDEASTAEQALWAGFGPR